MKSKIQGRRRASIADARSASLDRRYGKIGISAVAAALPYQSEPRTRPTRRSTRATTEAGSQMAAA